MALLIRKPTIFPSMDMMLCSMLYEFAGDTDPHEYGEPLKNPGVMLVILFNGSLKVEYPGTDQPARICNVGISQTAAEIMYPEEREIGKQSTLVTALEDNSEHYVISSMSLRTHITHVEKELTAGQTMVIQKGVVIIIFGNNYKVNGNIKSKKELFAIAKSNAIIEAIEPCKLFVFKAVPQVT